MSLVHTSENFEKKCYQNRRKYHRSRPAEIYEKKCNENQNKRHRSGTAEICERITVKNHNNRHRSCEKLSTKWRKVLQLQTCWYLRKKWKSQQSLQLLTCRNLSPKNWHQNHNKCHRSGSVEIRKKNHENHGKHCTSTHEETCEKNYRQNHEKCSRSGPAKIYEKKLCCQNHGKRCRSGPAEICEKKLSRKSRSVAGPDLQKFTKKKSPQIMENIVGPDLLIFMKKPVVKIATNFKNLWKNWRENRNKVSVTNLKKSMIKKNHCQNHGNVAGLDLWKFMKKYCHQDCRKCRRSRLSLWKKILSSKSRKMSEAQTCGNLWKKIVDKSWKMSQVRTCRNMWKKKL